GVGRPVSRLEGSVRFENVSFSYDGRESALEEVSFSVQPGEHVAIVGPSGVGKTTLVSLMLCFYNPTHGEILFDGALARDYNLKALRQRIGYVSQATILLSGTIRDNLQYGNPDASTSDLERAARIAGIHDFIQTLPGGYNAVVGERGVNLSEGQKQRLSIARALIKEPDILVMDEPTSALDGIVERSILESLPEAARRKTLFIVAHRPATIHKVDKVLLFNETRLVAVGRHADLLGTNDTYRSLFQ
ncbi:MAG: ABC transporter ATP-binding protein, partial [Chloroflexota bacterium]